MLAMLKELLSSKKAAALAGAWAGLTPLYIETHDIRFIYLLAGLHGLWLIAQGLADHGKSAAIVNAGRVAETVIEAVGAEVQKDAPEAATPKPPVLPLLALFLVAGLSIASLDACTPAEVKASPAAQEVKTATSVAATLCQQSPSMLADARARGISIEDVCNGVEAIAPWVQAVLGAQQEGEKGEAVVRAAARPCGDGGT